VTYQLTVNGGVKNFVAPNGNRYQAGAVLTVSDREYGLMGAGGRALVAEVYSGGTVSHTVTIASGKTNVVLPNGNRYKAGDVVVLSDEEYSTISAAAKAALFSADTTTLT
jgi:hypothetical protein